MAEQISTHAPRVRCDNQELQEAVAAYISTHAPRVRCDVLVTIAGKDAEISTHAPRVRCDLPGIKRVPTQLIFQLTHLV